MNIFTFITPDQHRIVVFATSYAHAVGVYALWFETRVDRRAKRTPLAG